MSSLRNAAQRRQHRERAQPIEREKLGLLEKHKDYSLRAKDFAAKKARLRILRQKATDRNPDEFHFAMMSSRVGRDGAKVAERGNKSLSNEVVKLLKTQDAGYLRTMAMKARREREKLEREIQLIDAKTEEGDTLELRPLRGIVNSERLHHKVFVDNDEALLKFDAEQWFQTDSSGLRKSYNRPRNGGHVAGDSTSGRPSADTQGGELKLQRKEAAFLAWKEKRKLQKKHQHDQERRRARLDAVKEREQNLFSAEQELQSQRAKMSNNVGGVNKSGIRFKQRERKR